MVVLAKKFQVSQLALENTPISVDQPGFDPTKSGQLQFINVANPSPTDLQQSILNQLQQANNFNAGVANANIDVSSNPSTTPFPLGCPSGFFQQGNTCIPSVGTYPQPYDFNPPAGQNYSKGQIQSITPPTNVTVGNQFLIQVAVKALGGVPAQYLISVTIPQLQINGDNSPSVLIPGNSQAIIYKQELYPSNAPTTGIIGGQISLQHLDNATGQTITDDTKSFSFPAASIAPPVQPAPITCAPGTRWSPCYLECMPAGIAEPAPGSPQCGSPYSPPTYVPPTGQCVQTQMCMTTAHWDPTACQCVPNTNPVPTPPPGPVAGCTPAPSFLQFARGLGQTILSDSDLDVDGFNFCPDEDVDIVLNIVLHGNTEFEGQEIHLNGVARNDHDGHHRARIHTPHIPPLTHATCILGHRGRLSFKTAAKDFDLS